MPHGSPYLVRARSALYAADDAIETAIYNLQNHLRTAPHNSDLDHLRNRLLDYRVVFHRLNYAITAELKCSAGSP